MARCITRPLCPLLLVLASTTLALPAEQLSPSTETAAASGEAPSIGPTPRGYHHDGDLAEWRQRQPTLDLPQGEGRRGGRLWVATSSSGLMIAGQVDGDEPRFEPTSESLRAGDHLVVRLRLAPDLELPPIGWGNQFGYEETPAADDCEKRYPDEVIDRVRNIERCRAWHAGQAAHRQRLERLFARRWVIGPGSSGADWRGLVIEEEASLAFAGLDLEGREIFAALAPTGRPHIKARPADGYGFEIAIPWHALPPTPSLSIDRIRLAVEAHRAHASPDEPESSIAALTELVIEQPRRYRVGPCGAPLEGLDLYNNILPAYYLPAKELEIEETLVLANQAGGYRYQPEGRSPALYRTQHFSAEAPTGELVCGPLLRTFSNNQTLAVRHRSKDRPVFIDRPISARKEDDDLVVTVGPRIYASRFGSGECGACPRVEALVYRLWGEGWADLVFEYYNVINPSRLTDVDIHVSEDWSTIEVFERRRADFDSPTRWYSKSWCRKALGYVLCAEEQESPGPASRVISAGREWEEM